MLLLRYLDVEQSFSTFVAGERVRAKAEVVPPPCHRILDYLHAVAAEKHQATKIITVDRNDFEGLSNLPMEQLD